MTYWTDVLKVSWRIVRLDSGCWVFTVCTMVCTNTLSRPVVDSSSFIFTKSVREEEWQRHFNFVYGAVDIRWWKMGVCERNWATFCCILEIYSWLFGIYVTNIFIGVLALWKLSLSCTGSCAVFDSFISYSLVLVWQRDWGRWKVNYFRCNFKIFRGFKQ